MKRMISPSDRLRIGRLRTNVLFLAAALALLSLEAAAQSSHVWSWVRPIGGPHDDEAIDVCLDAEGNAYVVGTFSLEMSPGEEKVYGYGYDFYIAKYDPQGRCLWVRTGGDAGWDDGLRVLLDGMGNVLVLGSIEGQPDFGDVTIDTYFPDPAGFVAGYTTEGEFRWITLLPTGGDRWRSGATGLATDGQGNAYVVGDTDGSVTWGEHRPESGGFLIKLDNAGTILWYRHLGDVHAADITFDEQGRYYVTGTLDIRTDIDGVLLAPRSHGVPDQFVIRYTDDDVPAAWGTTLASGLTLDRPIRSMITGNGRIVVAGEFVGTITVGEETHSVRDSTQGSYIACYDTTGALRWSRSMRTAPYPGLDRFPSENIGWNDVADVSFGPSGRLYATGTFVPTIDFGDTTLRSRNPEQTDGFVAEFDSVGALLWTARMGDEGDDWSAAITYAPATGVAVVGLASPWPSAGDDSEFGPLHLLPSHDEEIISFDGFLLRLDAGEFDDPNAPGIPTDRVAPTITLSPNPAATSITLAVDIEASTVVTIELFDLIGRRVATVPARRHPAGRVTQTIPVGTLMSGVYMVRMRLDDGEGEGEGIVWVGRVAVVR